jgi:asparaginyl-tRNA synthetase
MTTFTPISTVLLGGLEGKEVHLRGWIYRTRESGKIIFVNLRDASGVIQTPVKADRVPPEDFEAAKKALLESSVRLKGIVKKDDRAPGGWEIQTTGFELVHAAEAFPITEHQSPELLLDKRHLWLRSQKLTKVNRVKHHLLWGFREWLRKEGYWETTPSVITQIAGEGGSTLFPFKYFDQQAYLSQTAQMYLEVMMFSLEKVYSFTPSFRAEKSRTVRHLAEYLHLELETAWADMKENLRVQEEMLTFALHHVAKHAAAELRELGRDPQDLLDIKTPFERLDYGEAVERLQDMGQKISWGEDFGRDHEKALTDDRKAPLFITNYPKEIKAFYMKVDPERPDVVQCDDLLAPEGYGEIIGASVREEKNELMVERLQKEGAKLENYEWYLDLRRYGSVPHAGFGLGVERVLMWICKLDHVRDATPFPRVMNRASP